MAVISQVMCFKELQILIFHIQQDEIKPEETIFYYSSPAFTGNAVTIQFPMLMNYLFGEEGGRHGEGLY